ncbi:MAG: NirD/YgiW/YdeI family stress tolerance protein [Treponema sp.]|nr:NirD/YgiW/YdeI family stress tolerance protein [Treponema sp.]
MKKRFLIVCIIMILSFSGCDDLHFTEGNRGGFTGPNANITTVAQALNLPDDTPVIMQGRITKFLGNERYTFTDSTGSITVEIERRVWGSLTVGPDDLVEIFGEIDRDRNRIEVEVDRIRKL